jgi:coupling of ubiquitin conjugation to ER degradation protein 1
MGEVVNVLVAFAVIVFIFRWVTSSSESTEQRSAADTLGFRPKNVTQEMTDTVSNMFPDIPADNIRYDLLRTGNVGRTTDKILERGFLDAPPPAYYRLYPRANNTPPTAAAGAPATALVNKPKESLISRYQLEERARMAEPISEEEVGGKAAWEDTPEKREASLRERKAQMVLAARQRLLVQQQQQEAKTKKEVTES